MSIVKPGKLYDALGERIDSGKPTGGTFANVSVTKEQLDAAALPGLVEKLQRDTCQAFQDEMERRVLAAIRYTPPPPPPLEDGDMFERAFTYRMMGMPKMPPPMAIIHVNVADEWRPDPKLVALAQGAPLGGVAAFGLGRVDDNCERLAGRPAKGQ